MNNYKAFCKPTLATALSGVGLDQTYHRAEGQYLYFYDSESRERRVLDLLGGYGAVLLGHNHPEFVRVMVSQLEEGVAFHNQFSYRDGAAQLAAQLQPLLREGTGWNERFLCAFASTGAESVEVALMHAEAYRGQKLDLLEETLKQGFDQVSLHDDISICTDSRRKVENALDIRGELPDRDLWQAVQAFNRKQLYRPPVFIALKHAFHGKLGSTVQLTHGEIYRHPVRRLGLPIHFSGPGELTVEALKKLREQQQDFVFKPVVKDGGIEFESLVLPLVAGILVEPVQGEGGVHCLDEEQVSLLHGARDYLQCHLIADEVQSGCGRCGTFLAGSEIGLKPDYVVLSKALGGGISKIGLVAIRESQYKADFDLKQSSTFGEDDLSARVASAYVRALTSDNGAALDLVREKGQLLHTALCRLQAEYPDIVAEVRGKGLLQGVVFQDQSRCHSQFIRTVVYQEALGYLIAGHLLAEHDIRIAPPASTGNVLRIEPSVQISEQDIDRLSSALGQVCLALRYQDTGFLMGYLYRKSASDRLAPADYREWYDCLEPVAEGAADVKVAFINHLISSEWIRQVDPALHNLDDSQADKFLERFGFDRRVAPFPPVRMRSPSGRTVDFILYPISATSRQIGEMLARQDLAEIREAIDERIMAAREDGCTVAGLGMFTSVVTNNGKAVNVGDMKLTTGNALTAAMAIEAVKQTIGQRGARIETAAVIGAAGNIGAVYSSLVAEMCDNLVLIGSGRPGSARRVARTAAQVCSDLLGEVVVDGGRNARGIAAFLADCGRDRGWLAPAFAADRGAGAQVLEELDGSGQSSPIKVSEDLSDIADADLIICATNASEAFIDPAHIKKGAIVCDISVPHNISDEVLKTRPDITCVRGGIVSTPNGESLDPRARAYLKTGQVYACMAESIVMGFDQYPGHYSYGNISKAQVTEIERRAGDHGMGLAEFKKTESM